MVMVTFGTTLTNSQSDGHFMASVTEPVKLTLCGLCKTTFPGQVSLV